MITYTFLIQGSEVEPYEAVFYSDGKNIQATCTCAAGQYGQYCKHRIAILNGDDSKIVNNKQALPDLLAAFLNTPLYIKLQELKQEEKELEAAKEKFGATKKEFAKIMYGH